MTINVSTTTAGTRRANARLRREGGRVLRATRFALDSTSRRLEKDLEQATRRAVSGRLSRVWTRRLFPARGLSDTPAALVFPKGGERTRGAIRAFAFGARISKRRGGFVAIPLPGAALGRNRRPTPEQFEAARGVTLRPVRRRNGTILLVMPTLPGLSRTLSGRAAGLEPVFVLVRQTRIRAGFSIPRALERVRPRFISAFRDRMAASRGEDPSR